MHILILFLLNFIFQVKINFQIQGKFWYLLILRNSKHPLEVKFDPFMTEVLIKNKICNSYESYCIKYSDSPCSPGGRPGCRGAIQSTLSRFWFLSRASFEISPSFSLLWPLLQQLCLEPEKRKNIKNKQISIHIQSIFAVLMKNCENLDKNWHKH